MISTINEAVPVGQVAVSCLREDCCFYNVEKSPEVTEEY
jgi:hypothetical protein